MHPLEWAGRSAADKLEDLRKEMQGAGAGALLVTMLGEGPGANDRAWGGAGCSVVMGDAFWRSRSP